MLRINKHTKIFYQPIFKIDVETQGLEEDLLENKNKLKELYINYIGEEEWKDLYLQHPLPQQEWEIQSLHKKPLHKEMEDKDLEIFSFPTHPIKSLKNINLNL